MHLLNLVLKGAFCALRAVTETVVCFHGADTRRLQKRFVPPERLLQSCDGGQGEEEEQQAFDASRVMKQGRGERKIGQEDAET